MTTESATNGQTFLTLDQAREHFPAIEGRRPTRETIRKWARRGIHGVKLETVQVGRRIVVTPEAIAEFQRRLNASVV